MLISYEVVKLGLEQKEKEQSEGNLRHIKMTCNLAGSGTSFFVPSSFRCFLSAPLEASERDYRETVEGL